MLDIIVCIKQVPETSNVQIDPEKGTLKREGVDSKTNLFDLHALELAVKLKNTYGGSVTAISMGPPQAKAALLESYSLGVDKGILLSDRQFAGADTLATSYTLAMAIKKLPSWDLVITGMQTSDGDTAQVGPALAEMLGIPHVSYVRKVGEVDVAQHTLSVEADMAEANETLRLRLPALITCTKEVSSPRLPSYKLKVASKSQPVQVWGYDDIKQAEEQSYFGLDGSPTRVEKVFPPSYERQQVIWEGEPGDLARRMLAKLQELKVI